MTQITQITRNVILKNPQKLAEEIAPKLVKLAKSSPYDIFVSVDSKTVSAKSLGQFLSLTPQYEQVLSISADENAKETLDKIFELLLHPDIATVEIKLDVEPTQKNNTTDSLNPTPNKVITQDSKAQSKPLQTSKDNEKLQQSFIANHVLMDWSSFDPFNITDGESLKSRPLNAGIAIAPLFIKGNAEFTYQKYKESTNVSERRKLLDAITIAKTEIKNIIKETEVKKVHTIFEKQIEILEKFNIKDASQLIKLHDFSAAHAWYETMSKKLDKKYEQYTDIRDVSERVMSLLADRNTIKEPDEPYILVMQEIHPSDLFSLNIDKIVGIVSCMNRDFSSGLTIANKLNIPTIINIHPKILTLEPTTILIINGDTGEYLINPNQSQLDNYQKKLVKHTEIDDRIIKDSQIKAQTLDGHKIEIGANISSKYLSSKYFAINNSDTCIQEPYDTEIQLAVSSGAESVGLFRTEMAFMQHNQIPTGTEQSEIYRKIFEDLNGRPLTARTIDIGGHKQLQYLPIPKEVNPYMGMRGIRVCTARPEILHDQITALFKAAANRYPLRIMFPMITQLDEWRFAKQIVDEVHALYPCDDLQVGMMVETPATALMSHVFAEEVDFFSIGTNDLVQYTLAVDRNHPILSSYADSLHPGVLSLIDLTIHNAHNHGKWVSICGDIAFDTTAIPILVGMGVDSLSMPYDNIPNIKSRIRKLEVSKCRIIASQALTCASSLEIREMVKDTLSRSDKNGITSEVFIED